MQTHSTRGFRGCGREWRAALAAAMAVMLGAGANAANAADAASATTTANAAAAMADAPQTVRSPEGGVRAGCVEVEVNGQRSPSYDCLTNQLQPSSSPAAAGRAAGLESEDIANRPGNQVGGQFNWSATSQRMGNSFGHSATPQRPATPPPAPLIPGR